MDTDAPAAESYRRTWRPRRRQVIITAVVICAAAVVFFCGYRWHTVDSATVNVPSGITALTVPFPVYYPSPLPDGYTYEHGSASLQDGILFYKLRNGGKTILVSEQALPHGSLALGSLVGFSPMQTTNGTAYIGADNNTPTAIVPIGRGTLVSVSGSADVPSDAVDSIAVTLKPIRK